MATPTEDLGGTPGKSPFETHAFWQRFLDTTLDNKTYGRWKKAGKKTEVSANRLIQGAGKNETDLMNAVATIGRAQVSELLYNDPIPTCRAHKKIHRDLEPLWLKLLTHVAEHNELVHQQAGNLFLYWGVVCVKVQPSINGITFEAIRPDDTIFDEHWIDYGGPVEQKAFIIGERIQKKLSDLEDPDYNKRAVDQIISAVNISQNDIPLEAQEVPIWEFNVRLTDGWKVATWCEKASELLQWDDHPINEPSYSFLVAPGPRGLNAGLLADVVGLDNKANEVLKRSLTIAAERGHVIAYDKDKITKTTVLDAKTAVPIVAVQVPEGGNLRDSIIELKFGDMDARDAGAITFARDLMEWQAGHAREVTKPGQAPATATETRFVAAKEQQRALPWARLVDRYLDHAMYIAALWLKYFWDMGFYDLFSDVLDQEEMMLFANWMPQLSEDLQEFKIGVESGSTQQARDMQAVQQIDHFIEQLPLVLQALATEGKMLALGSLIKRYMRSLKGLGDPNDLIIPMTPEQQQDAQQQQEIQEAMQMQEMMGGGGGQAQPQRQGAA